MKFSYCFMCIFDVLETVLLMLINSISLFTSRNELTSLKINVVSQSLSETAFVFIFYVITECGRNIGTYFLLSYSYRWHRFI